MIKVGIIGGAGYTAGELIRLLLNHPDAEITFVNSTSNAGNKITDVHSGLYGETDLIFTDELPLDQIDLLFFCTAHGDTKKFMESHTVPENVKIIDGDDVCTELNTRGGPYSEAECESLISALAGTRAGVVCLCGSIPQGVEKGVYNSLIAKLREKGKICVLDCDGEAMKLGIEAFPDIIKPNLREAEELFISSGLEICSDYRVIPVENPWEKYGKTRRKVPEAAEKAAAMCGEISEFFSVRVLCTLGGDGAICAEPGNEDVLFCPAPQVVMRGFAGAGDSFLAAYLSSFFSESYKNDGARALVRAVAAGSAKVTIDGSGIPDAEAVDKMMSGTPS